MSPLPGLRATPVLFMTKTSLAMANQTLAIAMMAPAPTVIALKMKSFVTVALEMSRSF